MSLARTTPFAESMYTAQTEAREPSSRSRWWQSTISSCPYLRATGIGSRSVHHS